MERILYTRININDIVITEEFKNTTPNKSKIDKCREYYHKNNKLDRDIVLDENNILVDGYIGYLVLKENNIEKTNVIKKLGTIYIFGKHNKNNKTYVWRLPENKEDEISNINIGDKIWVKTSKGLRQITVTGIQSLEKPPVEGKIRMVSNKTFKEKNLNNVSKYDVKNTDDKQDILVCNYDYDKINDEYIIEFKIITPSTIKSKMDYNIRICSNTNCINICHKYIMGK